MKSFLPAVLLTASAFAQQIVSPEVHADNLSHIDRFAWIGAFSSGGLNTNYTVQFPGLDEEANGRLRLLWIAGGKEDRLVENNQRFVEWLKSKNVRHIWTETPGAHSFRVWRRYLAEFAPLLLQEQK